MARDNKASNSLNNSPFKTLKGLTVTKSQRPPSPVTPPPPVVSDDAEDRDLFAREMAWLNVRPVALKDAGLSTDASTPPPAGSDQATDTGAAEFLAAVGKLDKSFRDELPADDEPCRARPRRMKQLERGELRPGGELDLHGLTRDEALARTRTFLAHAARQGWPVVLVVTGKGLRSAAGPVLRQAVEHLLGESRDVVMEWGEAPRRFGGAGALAVFLRTGGAVNESGVFA